jgi:hypothetical protein
LEVLLGGATVTELAELPVDAIHANPRQPRRRFDSDADARDVWGAIRGQLASVRVEVAGLPARTVAPPGASWRRAGSTWEAAPA